MVSIDGLFGEGRGDGVKGWGVKRTEERERENEGGWGERIERGRKWKGGEGEEGRERKTNEEEEDREREGMEK